MQLFDMAIADIAAGAMALPDQRSIARLGILFHCVDERCVPAPTIDSGHAHAALKQIKRRFTSHAAAFGNIVGLAVGGAGARVYQHDLERRERMADALEFGLDVLCRCDIAIREVPEVEFHRGLEAPFERHLIDSDGPLPTIHGRGEMPRRIEMRRAVGRQSDPFDSPTFAVRQIFLFQPRKEFQNIGCRRLMIEIVDLRPITGRIGRDVVFKWNRNVDSLACHVCSPVSARLRLRFSPPAHEPCARHQPLYCLIIQDMDGRNKSGHNYEEKLMPAYWVARSKINDPVEYKKYTDLVPAIIEKFGGKVLARGGRFQIMEGPDKFHR